MDDGDFALRSPRRRDNARTSSTSHQAPTSLWGRVKAGFSKLAKAVSSMFHKALEFFAALASKDGVSPLDHVSFAPMAAIVGAALGSLIGNAVKASQDHTTPTRE